jgi:hypothetical protein
MAFSSTVAYKSVFGNTRVVCLSMVADSANGDTVASGVAGIGYAFSAHLSPISMATAAPIVKINKGNAGTSINGNVSISACATGDVFYLTIYGRS